MVGKTFALSLAAGNTVKWSFAMTGSQSYLMYSDNYYMTSFAGFLYEPIYSKKVIWSVHRQSILSGQASPVTFSDFSVNIGNGWNKTTNKYVVPYAGIISCT